jgi:hypothetical protein
MACPHKVDRMALVWLRGAAVEVKARQEQHFERWLVLKRGACCLHVVLIDRCRHGFRS